MLTNALCVFFFCLFRTPRNFLVHPHTHALFSFTVLPKLNSLCDPVFYMVELCNDAINYYWKSTGATWNLFASQTIISMIYAQIYYLKQNQICQVYKILGSSIPIAKSALVDARKVYVLLGGTKLFLTN